MAVTLLRCIEAADPLLLRPLNLHQAKSLQRFAGLPSASAAATPIDPATPIDAVGPITAAAGCCSRACPPGVPPFIQPPCHVFLQMPWRRWATAMRRTGRWCRRGCRTSSRCCVHPTLPKSTPQCAPSHDPTCSSSWRVCAGCCQCCSAGRSVAGLACAVTAEP